MLCFLALIGHDASECADEIDAYAGGQFNIYPAYFFCS